MFSVEHHFWKNLVEDFFIQRPAWTFLVSQGSNDDKTLWDSPGTLKSTYFEPPGGLVRTGFLDPHFPQRLAWQIWGRDWDFNKLSADAEASGSGPHFENHHCRLLPRSQGRACQYLRISFPVVISFPAYVRRQESKECGKTDVSPPSFDLDLL